jgi:probable phosphomutase (TIGR03848 family)
VTLVLLVRHGLTATTGSVLTGWTPGIPLDDRGRGQARALAARLATVPLDAIITSPLDRCRQTADMIAATGEGHPAVQEDIRVGECHYGDWTGQPLKRLAREPLWRVVQTHPGAARFPGADGESIMDMQHRAVTAVRDWNERLGPGAVYLICSHGDVIKSVIADGLGMHIDMLQRIQVDPCSLTAIRYTPLRPFLLRMNDTGGGVDSLRKPEPRRSRAAARRETDAAVGGGAGGWAGRED